MDWFRCALEFFEAFLVALRAESLRLHSTPRLALETARARGLRRGRRTEEERARLRRLIRAIDRRFPLGANCYRRVLAEIAMDSGAASEPVHVGLKARGKPGSGHVWLSSNPDFAAPYDMEFVA